MTAPTGTIFVARGGSAGRPAEQRTATFTGAVWMDAVLSGVEGVAVNNVSFVPGARTFWHHHEGGQLLRVLSGRGLVCAEGGIPLVLEEGDVAWTPPGVRHWHGADRNLWFVHMAVSLGETVWGEPVADADVRKPTTEGGRQR